MKEREEKHPLPLSSWPGGPHIFRNWTLGQISYFRVKLSTSVTDLFCLPDTSRRLLDSPALLCWTKVWRGVSIGMNDHTYCTFCLVVLSCTILLSFLFLSSCMCVYISLSRRNFAFTGKKPFSPSLAPTRLSRLHEVVPVEKFLLKPELSHLYYLVFRRGQYNDIVGKRWFHSLPALEGWQLDNGTESGWKSIPEAAELTIFNDRSCFSNYLSTTLFHFLSLCDLALVLLATVRAV